MEMPTMDWKNEMVKMLAAFERQAIHSLGNIKLALKFSGKSLNPDFKQYFLQVSNARLEEAYKHFENNSRIEDKIFNHRALNIFGATGSNSSKNRSQLESKELIRKIDYIEIDDSGDEKHTNRAPGMLKITSVESLRNFRRQRSSVAATLNGRSDSGALANNNGESRIGSTLIRKRTINPQINSFDGNHNSLIDATENKFIIPAVIGSQGDRLHDKSHKNAARDVVNRRTSIAPSYNRSNVVDVIEHNYKAVKLENNVTGRSMAEAKSCPIKNSNPSNQLVVKKRFKCQLCKYFGNSKEELKIHTRTHTGKKLN